MSRRTALGTLAPLLLAAAWTLPLSAQTYPTFVKGFRADAAVNSGGPDSIQGLSGALVVTLPLGQSYPLGPSLSYGLELSYNGRVWDFQNFSQNGTNRIAAEPAPRSNAGLGWMVSLGRLLSNADTSNTSGRWLLVSPDGGEHTFYNTLHEGDADDAGDTATSQSVLYSRDGSYLRLVLRGTSGSDVEEPDGTVLTFDSSGRLVKMRDRFFSGTTAQNQLTVSYPTTGPERWVLTDSLGRTQTVRFTTVSGAQALAKVVDRVELSAFGGATATYTFGYSVRTLPRPSFDNDPATSPSVAVPLFTSLTLPDGSRYSVDPDSGYFNQVSSTDFIRWPGSLRRLRLPTLGFIAWTYRYYDFPRDDNKKPYLSDLQGVASRSLQDQTGTVLGTWTYATELLPTPPGATKPTDLRNTVTDPSGHRRVSYFTVSARNEAGRSRLDYGLPVTLDANLAQAPATGGTLRYLSSEVYLAGSSTPLRSTYLLFERDQKGGPADISDLQNRNRRLLSSHTVFHDDSYTDAQNQPREVYAEEILEDFDGLGHYRTRRTQGTFQAANQRTEVTTYNPGRGRYEIDPATDQPTARHTFLMLPASSAWVLGIATSQSASESEPGVATETVQLALDSATGFLQCRRVLANGSTRGAHDVLVVYEKNAGGFPIQEKYYGGDGQNLGTSSECATGGLAPVYQLDHTYSSGVLATSTFAGQSWKSLDRTIDLATGLPSASRDASGVVTSLSFDALGRPVLVAPDGEARTEITYTVASTPVGGFQPAAVATVRKTGTGTSAVSYDETRSFFDSLGRLSEEGRLMPGTPAVWNRKSYAYTAQGWLSGETTVKLASETPSWATYSGFDPYGRPSAMTPADGSSHAVDFTYAGLQKISRRVRIATGASETLQTTTQVFDRQGRLYRVNEPLYSSLTDSPEVANGTTVYLYDAGGRLRQVDQTMAEATQHRYFAHDRRGFLTSEQHPEKGAAGNGSVTYSSFDPLGNPGRQDDGGVLLDRLYDSAGRLTEVRAAGDATRPFLRFTFSASAGNALGKLITAERWQELTVPGGAAYRTRVIEGYEYGELGGRVSRRTTEVRISSEVPGATFEQSFSYTPLGDLASQVYPKCTNSQCTDDPGTASPPTVSYSYERGWLTAIPTYATSIRYHANGLWSQLVHANNVVDTQANDPYGLARPASLSAALGSNTLWTSGSFAFDGIGNPKQIGGSTFRYDAISRLTEAHVKTDALSSTGEVMQTYTYDGFSNLLTTTGTVGRNTPTSPTTNRLTSAGSVYDSRGNLTAANGATARFGALGEVWNTQNGSEDWYHLYTADGERVFSLSWNSSFRLYTLRDLDGHPLRVYRERFVSGADVYSLEKDYVWRGGGLLASLSPTEGTRHFHLDHLGTPRLVTNLLGTRTAFHAYYPYGEEATPFNQDTEPMKFTGHERDLASAAGAADDLDYMHARFYSPLLGRFFSVDSAAANRRMPASWNRYAYVMASPLRYADPTGLEPDGSYIYGMGITTHANDTNINRIPGGFAEFTLWGQSYGSRFAASDPTVGNQSQLASWIAELRQYMQNRLDSQIDQGNYLAALIDQAGLDLIIPSGEGEAGLQLAMAIIPGPLDNAAYIELKGSKFFASFSKKGAFDQATRKIGRFTEFSLSVPGRVAGSYTRWVKVVTPEGRTIKLYHDTFNALGEFLHRGFKLPGPIRHVY